MIQKDLIWLFPIVNCIQFLGIFVYIFQTITETFGNHFSCAMLGTYVVISFNPHKIIEVDTILLFYIPVYG